MIWTINVFTFIEVTMKFFITYQSSQDVLNAYSISLVDPFKVNIANGNLLYREVRNKSPWYMYLSVEWLFLVIIATVTLSKWRIFCGSLMNYVAVGLNLLPKRRRRKKNVNCMLNFEMLKFIRPPSYSFAYVTQHWSIASIFLPANLSRLVAVRFYFDQELGAKKIA